MRVHSSEIDGLMQSLERAVVCSSQDIQVFLRRRDNKIRVKADPPVREQKRAVFKSQGPLGTYTVTG